MMENQSYARKGNPTNIPDNPSFIEKEWKSRGQNFLAAKLGKSHFNPLSIGGSIDLP